MKKHVETCDAHKEALSKLADMRVEGYMQDVLDTTPIGRRMKKIISPDDKTSMTIKFNTAYYLSKKERPFSDFEVACQRIGESYNKTISRIKASMEKRFADLVTSLVFRYQVQLLDTSTWPKDNSLSAFSDKEIDRIANHFYQLLSIKGCNIAEILPEWQALKGHMTPIVVNDKSAKYLDV